MKPVTHSSRRDLIWTIVRTDFKTRYHGSIGGFLWALAKPVVMFAVLWSVFSLVFASEPDYRLDLLIGLFIYDFFSDATKTALVALRTKGFLLSKARLPPWILVVTATSNAVITITVFSGVIVLVLTLLGRLPSLAMLMLFGFYIGCLFLVITGFCLGASVLFLRYQDLNQVWDLVTQAGFFVAPIIYPLGILPHGIHFYLYAWPPTPVIVFAREVLVHGTPPTLTAHMYLILQTAIIFIAGVGIYRRYSPRAAEYL